jgi:hypothetical protein
LSEHYVSARQGGEGFLRIFPERDILHYRWIGSLPVDEAAHELGMLLLDDLNVRSALARDRVALELSRTDGRLTARVLDLQNGSDGDLARCNATLPADQLSAEGIRSMAEWLASELENLLQPEARSGDERAIAAATHD